MCRKYAPIVYDIMTMTMASIDIYLYLPINYINVNIDLTIFYSSYIYRDFGHIAEISSAYIDRETRSRDCSGGFTPTTSAKSKGSGRNKNC